MIGNYVNLVNSKNGVNYYPDYRYAKIILDSLLSNYPDARLVIDYDYGWAIQYYPSGCYYPEIPDPNSRYNPANW